MGSTLMKPVYVWEIPVRIFHWVNAACIVALCATGYLIGDPPALLTSQEAYHGYWFGWVRFLHFGAAYLFTFNLIYRIFWGFVGNKYARLAGFFPSTKEKLDELFCVIKLDILQMVCKPVESIGHNAMAALTYLVLFLVSFFQIATGFGLLSAMSGSVLSASFAWVPTLVGGDMAARNLHHFTAWFFVLFAIVHVYLVCYHDYVEGRGVLSSIVGGWKFIVVKGGK